MPGQVLTAFSHLPVMIVFRNLFLYVFCLVLVACVSVVLLVPESLLPAKCGLEVPNRLRVALSLGADPARGDAGKELLRHAATIGNEEVVRLLLLHGVKPQNFSSYTEEDTFLKDVISSGGDMAMVRLLVENGASIPLINGVNEPYWGEIPIEMLEYLLMRGMSPAEDGGELSVQSISRALLKCYEGRVPELLDFLKQKAVSPKFRVNMLRTAVAVNKPAVVRALLQEGVTLVEADVQAGDILHAGCGEKRKDISELVQVLKENGFSLNQEFEDNETLLEMAFTTVHRDVYRVLVAAGADEAALRRKVGEAVYLAQFGTPEEVVAALPAATEEQQKKALHTALDCSRADVAHALLDAGVPMGRVKPSSVAFDTALLRRVLNGAAEKTPEWRCDIAGAFLQADEEAYPMLLEAYGDINDKLSDDVFYDSLLESALMVNNVRLVRFLLKNGASMMPEAVFSCCSVESLEALLEAGLDINIRDELGETLLMRAVFADEADFAAELLKRGVDINARNKEGETALHIAVMHGDAPEHGDYPDMMQMLLKAGADASICNAEGQTAEDLAIEYARRRVLRVLREHRK